MAFDASVMRCFVLEAAKMVNAKIDKIHQPQKDELLISLRSFQGNFKLYISANPSYPRIHFSQEKTENPAAPPMFCMLLRKHLAGGKIISVSQVGFERILVIEVESYDELGDLTIKKMIVEIMGKHSNIILTDQKDKIIDSIKRIDISTSSVRQILPGLTYHYPPLQEKKNPLETDFFSISYEESRSTEGWLMEQFYGISKLMARELVFLSQSASLPQVLNDTFSLVRENHFAPCIIYQPNGEPLDFNALPITQYGSEYNIETDPSISAMVEQFFADKATHLRLHQNSAQLIKLVNNNIERCKKKLKIFHQQLLDSAKRDKYKEYGDLITANLYRIQESTEEIEVENYFKEDLPLVKIKLDANISPAKNAQKYFTKYNKAKNAEAQALIQIESAQAELDYLESVLDAIQRVETNADIAEIKEELCTEGYLAKEAAKGKKKQMVSRPEEFEIDGYRVLVGKNNKQNDYLTLKLARSQDIWLHTKNIPGSHVIISKHAEEEIPDAVVLKAAKLAAGHSKGKNSAQVPVDYTQVKNVKKPAGAKPGMVIYDHYNTVYVTP